MSEKIDITEAKDGGILKQITAEGEGNERPCTGDKVYVHYTGTLEDGTVFDSSRERGDKFDFTLGTGQVIKAWDVGVATMKKGERCLLTCRSDYAYGETGSPPKIPGGATLIFDVELYEWKGEDISEENDGSITRRILTKGEGYSRPNDGATVHVSYKGFHDGREFESRDVDFVIGEGVSMGVISGLEHSVKKFNKGEKSLLTLAAKHCYGSTGHKEFGIPGGAELKYEVTLRNFEKAKESWEMETDEKLEQSEIVKNKGTEYFKGQNFKQAQKFYQKAVDYLQYEDDFKEDSQKKKRREVVLAAHLNLAMCGLKTEDPALTITHCDKALELEANSEKAYFRRAQANMLKKEYVEAITDFRRVLEMHEENKAAKNQIAIAQNKIKQEKEKEKKTFAGMFSKFATEDAKKDAINKSADTANMQDIGTWENKLADGMLSLEQELEAFGEKMPEPRTKFDNKENINK